MSKQPKTPYKMTFKVSQRGRYGLGLTLDKRWCLQHGITAGDGLEQFEDPKNARRLIIELPADPESADVGA